MMSDHCNSVEAHAAHCRKAKEIIIGIDVMNDAS